MPPQRSPKLTRQTTLRQNYQGQIEREIHVTIISVNLKIFGNDQKFCILTPKCTLKILIQLKLNE